MNKEKPIAFTNTSLKDWKLVYLVLYKNIPYTPDIMDVEFFSQLQTLLQRHAENQRINPLDHEEWIEWLKEDNTAVPSGGPTWLKDDNDKQ